MAPGDASCPIHESCRYRRTRRVHAEPVPCGCGLIVRQHPKNWKGTPNPHRHRSMLRFHSPKGTPRPCRSEGSAQARLPRFIRTRIAVARQVTGFGLHKGYEAAAPRSGNSQTDSDGRPKLHSWNNFLPVWVSSTPSRHAVRASGTLSGHAVGGFGARWDALKVPEARTARRLSWLDSTLFLARQRPGVETFMEQFFPDMGFPDAVVDGALV